MTTYTAQRLRFGVLAARHALERHRLTDDQLDFLEGCETVGWAIKYSAKAFDREYTKAWLRSGHG